MIAALVVGLAVVVAPFADAQVYRWVDEDGTVHFSDRPPPGAEADELAIRSERTDLEATLRRQVERERELELREQLQADEAEDAAAEREYRERLAHSCAQARERVARIEGARRLTRVDADGERRDYTEADRAAALAEARTQVAEWCR